MKKYKIDKSKNIGNVIFVVEGGRADTGGTELRLLKKIFVDVLDYEVQELRRGSMEFIAHGNNSNYHVFALNLDKNQLTQLNEDSLDKLFYRIRNEFKIKPEDCPVFFLYDRDVLSYHRNELRGKYVKKYTDPYGTDDGTQGQLLLSYPCIESFLISCLIDDTYNNTCKMGREAKSLLTKTILSDSKVFDEEIHEKAISLTFTDDVAEAERRLIHSINEMDSGLKAMGINEYDLDNLAPTLLSSYDYEQERYNSEDTLLLFSLAGMALLELGVIVECGD